MTSVDCPPPFSRHSNKAGTPLPRIPRRMSYSTNSRPSTFIVPDSPAKPTALVVQPPTPPPSSFATPLASQRDRTSSDSSSPGSSDTPVHFLVARHRRGHSSLMRSPEESTPTPAVFHSRSRSSAEQVAFPTHRGPTSPDTPRPSSSGGNQVRPTTGAATRSEPQPPTAARVDTPSRAVSESVPANVTAQLARKKSGEPLKSSLKSRRAVMRGDLSVVTGEATGVGPSKSEPTTPTHSKSVHFDSQLEHVKLFLAEQKPLAVSRDGSPTTDTSGTDSDFPAFIYGEDDKREKMGRLRMEVVNMPASDTPARKEAECALEELHLGADGAAVQGRVRVKNVAFEKWVAVRFTLDWWQTTSEVTARYVHTCEGGAADVFAFTIRLTDVLARIEEKTLFLAVRYTVAGREIWDNNAGENFHIRFSRQPEAPPACPAQTQAQAQGKAREKALSQSESETEREEAERKNMSDLRIKLEKVASGQESRASPGFAAHRKTPSPRADSFDLRSPTPLASRYDFSAALKRSWKSPVLPTHTRTRTYPASASPPSYGSYGRPRFQPRGFGRSRFVEDPAALSRGSPRITDTDDEAPSPVAPKVALYSGSDSEDASTATPIALSRNRGRHHQLGYFDLGLPTHGSGFGSARKALPAAFREDAIPRYNSMDAYRMPAGASVQGAGEGLLGPWPLTRGGSEESTPSATSQSEESSSASSSPSGSPGEMSVFDFMGGLEKVRSPVNDPAFNVFVNKFCFYTGADSLLDAPQDALQRSHSASSVEEFLSSPNPNYHLSPGQTPTRSSSFDDVACMSGASTPTMRRAFESQTSTPIALVS